MANGRRLQTAAWLACVGLIACSGGPSGGGGGTVTYGVAGTVAGDVLGGVRIDLSGTSGTSNRFTTTDASGNYSFTGLTNGAYTVAPSKPGCSFSPSSLSPTVNDADVTGQDFTASWTGFTIAGVVSGAMKSGVTITISGGSNGATTTDIDGGFAFTGLSNGTYTLTPSYYSEYTFEPRSAGVTVNDPPGTIFQNFTATDAGWASWRLPPATSPGNYTVGTGTVRDNVTGLVWQQTANGVLYDRVQATSHCQSLNLGGWSSGWRLPTLIELESIVDYGRSMPSINGTAFPSTPSAPFWSSSPYLGAAGAWWFVNFVTGETAGTSWSSTLRVRCVR